MVPTRSYGKADEQLRTPGQARAWPGGAPPTATTSGESWRSYAVGMSVLRVLRIPYSGRHPCLAHVRYGVRHGATTAYGRCTVDEAGPLRDGRYTACQAEAQLSRHMPEARNGAGCKASTAC